MPVWTGSRREPEEQVARRRLAVRVAKRMSNRLLPLIVQCVLVAFLTLQGLDRGFIGQFSVRVQQSPWILQAALLSFALQMLTIAAWAACTQIGSLRRGWEFWEPYYVFVGSTIAGAAVRYILALFKAYVPLLSPLTLALTAWTVWPTYTLWNFLMHSIGSSNAFLLAAIMTIVWPPLSMFAGKAVGNCVVGAWEKRRLLVKGVKKMEDYVKLIVESPNPAKVYGQTVHDHGVAFTYGNMKRHKAIEAAWDYIRKNYYGMWSWMTEAYCEEVAETASPRAECELRDDLKDVEDFTGFIKYFLKSADVREAMRNLQNAAEEARKSGEDRRFREICAAIRYIILNYSDRLQRGWQPEEEKRKAGKALQREKQQLTEEERKVSKAEGRKVGEAEGQKAVGRELLDDLKSLKIFEGVVGLDDVKREIVWRFLLPLFFPDEAEGVKPSGGILIYGPTGTGKTEVMRVLLDACRKLEIQVLECKPSDVMVEYVGATEQKIRNLFEKARETRSIIFIDEADGLLGVRADYEASWSHTVLKEFLEQMDGLRENDKLLIIACTNEPWRIAEPVLRPGRLGSHFYAPPPGKEERRELFKLFLKGVKVEGEIDCERLAELTKPSQRGYYCGADIKAICERAYMRALRNGRKAATMADLEAVTAETRPSISTATVQMYERFAQKYTPLNQTPKLDYVG